MPGSFTTYTDNKILDHCFGANQFAVSTLHFGYFLTTSSKNGAGAEPSGNGYARTPVPPDFWLESSAQMTQNVKDIVCPRSQGEQGDIIGCGIFDSSVGGNCLVYFTADSSLLIRKLDSLVALSGALVHQWNAGGLSNYLKNKIFNHIYKAVPMAVEPTIYIAWTKTAGTDAAPGNEPNTGGYARYPLANNSANFAPATGGVKETAAPILYAKATALQGDAAHFAFFTAVSGGQYLGTGPLNPVKTVDLDDELGIIPGGIKVGML